MQKKGNDYFHTITLQSMEEGFTPEELNFLLENKVDTAHPVESTAGQNSGTAWTEQKQETVSTEGGGRSQTADVLAIYGSSRHLLPFGRYLSPEDPGGCLISQTLAEKLFGAGSAEGQNLLWQNQDWKIRGILPLSHCLVIAQTAGMDMDVTYQRINIPLKPGESRQITGENFILRNNLSAHVLRLDYLYQWSWLQELIPGKWSDFDGWKQNQKKQAQEAELAKQAEHSTLEADGLEKRRQGNLCLFAGLVLCAGGMLIFLRK